MGVGIKQLEEVFSQAAGFDRDPASLDTDALERNLVGVIDDFKNVRGNDARLREMDERLAELVIPLEYEKPGLATLLAHVLATLFENYANEGRGFRKAYEFTQEKRTVATIDGPFIYEELVPGIFEETTLHEADGLRFYLTTEIARFLEDKDPGGHWPDRMPLEQVSAARTDTLLVELLRRRVCYQDVPNLARKAHTLEQRLAEAGFFGETAQVRRVLGSFFERLGYVEPESFWTRLRRKAASLGGGRSTFGRLGRWRMVYRLQLTYMMLAVVLSILTVFFWNWRQGAQLELLEQYYNRVSELR
jgi:hypothetical protein